MAEKDRFRVKEVRVKITEQEYEILNQNCYELDMSKSEFIRQIIIYGRLTEKVKYVDDDTLYMVGKLIKELNYIGNNINQIAYGVNVKNKTEIDDLKLATFELKSAIRTVVDIVTA